MKVILIEILISIISIPSFFSKSKFSGYTTKSNETSVSSKLEITNGNFFQ